VQWLGWTLLASAATAITLAKKLAAPPTPYTPLPGGRGSKKVVQVSQVGQALPPAGQPLHSSSASARLRRASSEPGIEEVDAIVARHGPGKDALIPILQDIQEAFRYLPADALQRVCEKTEIAPAQLAGVASFYASFRHTPVGEHRVRVCHGTACHVAGARQISDELRRSLRIPEGGDTDAERLFTLEEVACLGCCSLAPVLTVDGETVGKLTPASAREALEDVHPREMV
jgi:NADH:ubiquinone oxidoreductase subunit E